MSDVLYLIITAVLSVLTTLFVIPYVLKLLARFDPQATAEKVYEYAFKPVFGSKANTFSNVVAATMIELFAQVILAEPDTAEESQSALTIVAEARKLKEANIAKL